MAKEDLIPFNKSPLSKDEVKAINRKGGIASGKARREKKLIRETIETILSMPLKAGAIESLEDMQGIAEANGANMTVQEVICIQMAKKAMKGDTKAAEYLRDTAGQKPTDVVSILEPPVIIDDIPKDETV